MTTPPSNAGPTPPPSARGRRRSIDWEAITTTLRRRPRTWALVFEGVASSRATEMRKQCPQLEVRSATATVDGRKRIDVYARYIPAKPVEAVS